MKPILVLKPMLVLSSVSVASIASTASIALTQPTIQSFEQRKDNFYTQQGIQSRQYDPTTVETIAGDVTNINRVGQQGVHLLVQTDDETIDVHLGPEWYLEEQDFVLATGDRIEVTGSRIDSPDTPALIAAQVRSGENVLTLRDANGLPVWRGMGQNIR